MRKVSSRLMGCTLAAKTSGQHSGGKIHTSRNFFARSCKAVSVTSEQAILSIVRNYWLPVAEPTELDVQEVADGAPET